MVHDAHEQSDAVLRDGQPVGAGRRPLAAHDHLEASLGVESDVVAGEKPRCAQGRRIEFRQAIDSAFGPVARAEVGRLLRGPRRHHEVRDRPADAGDPVVVATVDELGEQVILVGRLEIDSLAPRGVAQPRPLRLAVLHVPLEAVAHQPGQESVPLSAIELVDLRTEPFDQVTGAAHRLAEIVPCAAGGEPLRCLVHASSPMVGSTLTPNRS